MIDPFWHKLQQAYNQAVTRREQVITIEHGDMRADIEAASESVIIVITNIEPEPTPLVIPPGSMTKDPRDSDS